MFETGKLIHLDDMILPSSAKPLRLKWVESGEFLMGYAENAYHDLYDYYKLEIAQIKVRLTQGFWLGEYPITQAHWEATGHHIPLKSKLHYETLAKEGKQNIPVWRNNPNLPMYWCNWIEAMLYCRDLNIRYKQHLPEGYHFSLPTEAQWEYACKAGTQRDYREYQKGEYEYIERPDKIREVGLYPPNAWGFYDMLNTVHEMCFDIPLLWHNHNMITWVLENYHDVDNSILINWLTGIYGEKEFGTHDICFRTIKGSRSSIFRAFTGGNWIFHPSGIPVATGFRIALRPITMQDQEDDYLKENGINMLGD